MRQSELSSRCGEQLLPAGGNSTPFYYLINEVAFNKTQCSRFGVRGYGWHCYLYRWTLTTTCCVTTGITGTVLERLVNVGLRMHVPSIVNSLRQGFNGTGAAATVGGFALIAEDGNVIPGVAVAGNTIVPAAPRGQTDVFMAAGKTFDVLINVPTATVSGTTTTAALPAQLAVVYLGGKCELLSLKNLGLECTTVEQPGIRSLQRTQTANAKGEHPRHACATSIFEVQWNGCRVPKS